MLDFSKLFRSYLFLKFLTAEKHLINFISIANSLLNKLKVKFIYNYILLCGKYFFFLNKRNKILFHSTEKTCIENCLRSWQIRSGLIHLKSSQCPSLTDTLGSSHISDKLMSLDGTLEKA